MATNKLYDSPDLGLQVGQNHVHTTAQLSRSETSLNQACLRDLRTTRPHDDKERIEKISGGLLLDSYRWILDNEQFNQWQNNQSSRLLWIRGDPGKGKTMLLCGIIDILTRSIGGNANISFFFCQATDVRLNNAAAVLRGLIYSLVERQPSLLCHVRSQYDQAEKTFSEDLNANALSKILDSILKDPTLQNTYLVIDALDECTTDLPILLDLVFQEASIHSPVKWIVSSRNWPNIEERLDTTIQPVPILLELNEASISDAVKKFIQHKVHELAEAKNYSDEISDIVYRYLLLNSQGTFLWVALVCQDLLRISRMHILKKLKEFPPGVDALYGKMIDKIRKSEDAELCRRILGVILIVYRPITLTELTSLVELPDELSGDYKAILQVTIFRGSFLALRDNVIFFFHQSAKEFLLRKAQIEIFPGDKAAEHLAIFSRSLQILFKTLRRNIFDVKLLGSWTDEFTQRSPNPLAAVKYACVYWINHLQEGWYSEDEDHSLDDGGYVDSFLRKKYLHWLEALAILGCLPEGIAAMLKLKDLLQKRGKSHALFERVQDASRFIQYCRQAIEDNPLQVYSSALIFSPTRSITRICYHKEKPDWILNSPVVEQNWSICFLSLKGHRELVTSIAWSPDGSRLASASYDNTIRIWDLTTGQCASTLKGHRGSMGADSHLRLFDNTINIWGLTTGQCASTLKGHRDSVTSIAWSPDGSRLVSASDDRTVKIWDPTTGQCASTLEGHRDSVRSIAWSPDGSRLASASNDNTIKIWDPTTSQCISTLEGHSYRVELVAWSPDGSRLASASYDNTIKIWDPTICQCISTLEGHSYWVESVVWSPDGSRLASASYDNTIRIWDPTIYQCISTLEGHSEWVKSVVWSPDGSRLASASGDSTVKIWDPTTGQCASTLEGHRDSVTSIAWSPDGSRLASASNDNTIKIWDPPIGQYVSPLKGYRDSVRSIAWSPDRNRLVSTSRDRTVKIWDPTTGQCTFTLEGHRELVTSIAWSPDGSRLASASYDNTIRIWDLTTGQCASTLKGHRDSVMLISWSPDGSRLASASDDRTVKIWDPTTGQCASTLEGHRDSVTSIAWSPDGSRLASASYDNTIKIWDLTTGQCASTLEGHRGSVRSIAWSPDGSRLASASDDRTVKIWDPATSQYDSSISISSSSFLQFDEVNPYHLHTSRGTLDVGCTGFVTRITHNSNFSSERHRYGMNDDFSWITYEGVNIIWLPAEYRPNSSSRFVVSGTRLAIGCPSGRVFFLEFPGKDQSLESVFEKIVPTNVDTDASHLQGLTFLQYVDKTVRGAYGNVSDTVICAATFDLTWELRECVLHELDGDPDLGPSFTISGDSSHAWAVSCLEYVETIWGDTGRLFLFDLETILRKKPDNSSGRSLRVTMPELQ
ncbi:hypothetical protein N7526_004871 [Penicillium atrosanguineum]|nr:hypothetical protein N7526_004871 [Penicillium atrosanguineum]